jgi:AcrR family transcriptional regulator
MGDATRDRLVFTAMQLFAEKGYGSTSVADILKAAGANSGSLYHFFPTKQDLLLEALARYRDGIGPMLLEPAWAGVADPIERVFALLAAYRAMLARSDCLYGCTIGSLAIERCFVEAGARLPTDLDRKALAVFTLTTMEGGVMQSRTQRTLAAFDQSVAMLRDYVRRLESDAKRNQEGGNP